MTDEFDFPALRCPVCDGTDFEERYWDTMFRGGLLRRRPLRGMRRGQDSLRWRVCLGCGHVATFVRL